MWNGHIVPIIDDHILLPANIRHALGFVKGTRLIASAYRVKQHKSPLTGEQRDLHGGILFSLTRKRAIDRAVRFTFFLENKIGAIHYVAGTIANHEGQVVRLEGLASGHATCQVVFPSSERLVSAVNALLPTPNSIVQSLQVSLPPIASPNRDERLMEALIDIHRKWTKRHSKNKKQQYLFTLSHDTDWIQEVLLDSYELENLSKQAQAGNSVAVRGVRVGEDGIPFPSELFECLTEVGAPSSHVYRRSPPLPEHVVIATTSDLLALNCLIPSRPLFSISVRSHTYSPRDLQPGTGVVSAIAGVLGDFKIGIVHMQIENTECRYSERPSDELSKLTRSNGDEDATLKRLQLLSHKFDALSLRPRYEDGVIRLIAAVPSQWTGLGAEQIDRELNSVKLSIQSISLRRGQSDSKLHSRCQAMIRQIEDATGEAKAAGLPGNNAIASLTDLGSKLQESIAIIQGPGDGRAPADQMEDLKRTVLRAWVRAAVEWRTFGHTAALSPTGAEKALAETPQWSALGDHLSDIALRELLDSMMTEHSLPLQEVDIHGPPLLRCFFAHSDRPDDEERRLTSNIREMLQQLSFHVIEGKWTYGKAIDDTTRAQIKKSAVLVSLLWPRTKRRENEVVEEHLASEWVVHEESFAMGAGVGLFRFREQTVREPRYRRDFREYMVDRNDPNTWIEQIAECREQLKRYVIARVLVHDD